MRASDRPANRWRLSPNSTWALAELLSDSGFTADALLAYGYGCVVCSNCAMNKDKLVLWSDRRRAFCLYDKSSHSEKLPLRAAEKPAHPTLSMRKIENTLYEHLVYRGAAGAAIEIATALRWF